MLAAAVLKHSHRQRTQLLRWEGRVPSLPPISRPLTLLLPQGKLRNAPVCPEGPCRYHMETAATT